MNKLYISLISIFLVGCMEINGAQPANYGSLRNLTQYGALNYQPARALQQKVGNQQSISDWIREKKDASSQKAVNWTYEYEKENNRLNALKTYYALNLQRLPSRSTMEEAYDRQRIRDEEKRKRDELIEKINKEDKANENIAANFLKDQEEWDRNNPKPTFDEADLSAEEIAKEHADTLKYFEKLNIGDEEIKPGASGQNLYR